MIFRELDADSDWTFGKGKNNYLSLDEAIKINIKTRLLSWVNDCFFSLTSGVDWLNRLGSKNQKNLLETDLRRIISQSEGVTGILSFDIVVTGRNFSASYTVQTIYNRSFTDSLNLEG